MLCLKALLTTTRNYKKKKKRISKELDESVINGEQYQTQDFKEKVSKVEKSRDVAAVFGEFEKIIKSKKRKVSIPTK